MAVQNKFEVLAEDEEMDQQRVTFKETVKEAELEQLSRVERKRKQKSITDDIVGLTEKNEASKEC